jgi:hypothetical protein
MKAFELPVPPRRLLAGLLSLLFFIALSGCAGNAATIHLDTDPHYAQDENGQPTGWTQIFSMSVNADYGEIEEFYSLVLAFDSVGDLAVLADASFLADADPWIAGVYDGEMAGDVTAFVQSFTEAWFAEHDLILLALSASQNACTPMFTEIAVVDGSPIVEYGCMSYQLGTPWEYFQLFLIETDR